MSRNWEYHYVGAGYPSKTEIDADAKARGFTHSYWASEYGYNGFYNGDTVITYCNIEDLPEEYRVDAAKYGKPIYSSPCAK